jgi:lipid II:glycine glycyltransferase (peptidoglycan interpeptide bridge formation enzyme)
VIVEAGSTAYEEFWPVLERNLRERYGRHPVHTLAEIQLLQARFPEQIELIVARHEGRVVAGTVLFHTGTATHAQYIAAAPQGRELAALDLVFERAIALASQRGHRVFDFGISTEQEGKVLNASLEQFKHEFGSGTVAYDTFEVSF